MSIGFIHFRGFLNRLLVMLVMDSVITKMSVGTSRWLVWGESLGVVIPSSRESVRMKFLFLSSFCTRWVVNLF